MELSGLLRQRNCWKIGTWSEGRGTEAASEGGACKGFLTYAPCLTGSGADWPKQKSKGLQEETKQMGKSWLSAFLPVTLLYPEKRGNSICMTATITSSHQYNLLFGTLYSLSSSAVWGWRPPSAQQVAQPRLSTCSFIHTHLVQML